MSLVFMLDCGYLSSHNATRADVESVNHSFPGDPPHFSMGVWQAIITEQIPTGQ